MFPIVCSFTREVQQLLFGTEEIAIFQYTAQCGLKPSNRVDMPGDLPNKVVADRRNLLFS